MTASPDIKPIETRYAGCRFRSRLEARWAVFFDILKIEWQYEPQGYLVGPPERRRPYLPDFYLPERALWIEVKGHAGAVDYDLLVDAAHPATGLPLELDAKGADWPLLKLRMLLLGPVPENPLFHQGLVVIDGTTVGAQLFTPICDYYRDDPENARHIHQFTSLLGVVRIGPGEGNEAFDRPTSDPLGVWGYGFPCQQIHDAYTAARSARFEHGEVGW